MNGKLKLTKKAIIEIGTDYDRLGDTAYLACSYKVSEEDRQTEIRKSGGREGGREGWMNGWIDALSITELFACF